MALASREDILKARERTFKDVYCPELEGEVRIQSLMANELEEYQASNRGKPDKEGNVEIVWKGSAARLVARCAVDADGNRLFSDTEALSLGKLNAALINRLFAAACKLNGIGEKEMEEMVKNSEPGQGAGE